MTNDSIEITTVSCAKDAVFTVGVNDQSRIPPAVAEFAVEERAQLLERIAEQDAEIARLTSRYDRDVLGLNNEGDPIGGDPAGGYLNEIASLRAKLQAAPAERGVESHRVLLLCSYCGDDNQACTDAAPCRECLGMCNVAMVSGDMEVLGGFEYLNPAPATADNDAREVK